MSVRLREADVHLIDVTTRMPFKYGIATMTRAPHAFVRAQVEVDGETAAGVAADVLPPKWFTKNPETPPEDEIRQMLEVIEHAVEVAPGLQGGSAYEIWQQLDGLQRHRGTTHRLPPLLSNFGTSLVERAVIEAVCRAAGKPFYELARENGLGLQLADFDERLQGFAPGDLLPVEPLRRVIARHTVGMADPLTSEEIADGDRLDDGLPQSLDECIDEYGLQHFKIKLQGEVEHDADRLARVAAVLAEHADPEYAFSVDGNERFQTLDEFRDYWRALVDEPRLQPFFGRLLFVEQPFHRDVALEPRVVGGLADWSDRPSLIIDESDAEPDSLVRALQLGYHGTSHKNCKGVFKSLANACLLEKLRRDDPGGTFLLSGEDLANIGPVALLQDLAVAASLGISSIERNGHHYFAGLSAFPQAVQEQVLENHNDLYFLAPAGWPTLDVQNGRLDLRSVVAAPLGVGFELDVEQFTPADEWKRQRGFGA